MAVTPSSLQTVMEVEATTVGDQAPTPAVGSLEMFANQNGKWYKKDSAGVVTPLIPGVDSFNGRFGTVVPIQADYDSFFLTPAEGNAAYQPLDSDLTAIAALTTTAFGRSLLDRADAAAVRAYISVYSQAQSDAQYQPLDADLTAIAAMATTSFGRSFLDRADAAAARAYISVYSQAQSDAQYQPLDTDLTAIAALTTTAYGRALLTLANSAALTAAIDVAGALKGLMSAADFTYLVNQRKAFVNILDFGGDNTGVASSATALTNAQAALPSGGIIWFPPGTYQFGNVNYNLSTAHITLKGSARYNTVFTTSSTNSPIITRNQYYQTIEDITFTGTGSGQNPSGTAGQTLVACNAANSAYGVIRRCTGTYGYILFDISDTLSIVDDVECRFFKFDGVLVNQNSDHKIRDATMDNNTSFLPTGGGIDVTLTASLLLINCNIIHSNFALNLNAGAGVTIPSVKGINCFFDTSAVGLNITGGGSILRSEFTNCWFSSMSSKGIALTPAAGGQVDGLTFVNCDIYNNVGGTTIGIDTNAQTKKWSIVGSNIAGWTTGINLVPGASHFPQISAANRIGTVSAFGVNTTGIVIGAGTYAGLVIDGNDVTGNTTALTNGAVTVANFANYRIVDNPGINPSPVTNPAVPATGVVKTNDTGRRVTIYAKYTVLATAVAVNGTATVLPIAAQLATYQLDPGGTIAITDATMPTWTWIGN